MGGRPARDLPQSKEEMMVEISNRKPGVYRKSDTLAANEQRIKQIVTMAATGLENVAYNERIKLSDTEAVKAVTLNYVRACAECSVIPNTAGLAKALGMSRQALYDHIKRHPDSETAKWLTDTSDSFGQILIDAAISGVVSPIPAIFAAKARYGWRDSGTVVEIDNSDITDLDADAIAEKYSDMPD